MWPRRQEWLMAVPSGQAGAAPCMVRIHRLVHSADREYGLPLAVRGGNSRWVLRHVAARSHWRGDWSLTGRCTCKATRYYRSARGSYGPEHRGERSRFTHAGRPRPRSRRARGCTRAVRATGSPSKHEQKAATVSSLTITPIYYPSAGLNGQAGGVRWPCSMSCSPAHRRRSRREPWS